MKVGFSRTISVASLAAGSLVLFSVSSVFAGAKNSVPLTLTSTSAEGDMATVRNSADSVSFIGCQMNTGTLYCYAQDAQGTYQVCFTQDASLIKIGTMIDGSSMLRFSWDAFGHCTHLQIANGSSQAPKGTL